MSTRFGSRGGWMACALAATLVSASCARALSVGDVAVISFASDNPDAIAFVVLREVPAGAVIRFTDSGWFAGGGFRANEGGIQYTAGAALAPGTVVSRANPFTSGGWAANNAGLGSGGFALSASGDQILSFTGDASSPSFVHAVHFDDSGYSDATSSNTTALPTGLVEGTSAVAVGEADNGYYNGPTTGTASDLLAVIGNPGNWTTSDSPVTPPVWSFTVSPEGPMVQSVSLPGSDFDIDAEVDVSVALSAAPDIGNPVTVELTSSALGAPVVVVITNPDTNGVALVTLANEGYWTLSATAMSNGIGSAVSDGFIVGDPQFPPTVFAGGDRSVQPGTATVTIELDEAEGDDLDGLAGATYAWTPVTTTGLVSWQNRTGPMSSVAAPGTAIVTFDAIGTYTLTLTVNDADELTASDSLTITVTPPTPVEEFDPPPGYYATATGTGATLKAQLAAIMTAGHDEQRYGDFKTNSARYDADPNVPGHILLVYNRASVSGAWDGGGTWNREHVWPQSHQPGSASDSSRGNLGDPYALRPVNPSINSSRSNKPFGTYSDIGSYGSSGSYYFPGDEDKGDIARSLFYSATRYMSTLSLVDGVPSGNTMGDRGAALRWHYTDVPDLFERRRGQLIYEDQHNRNAYIDRPEFVWSIFGDGANDSRIHISASEPPDGASAVLIDFPPIIVGGPLPAPETVMLSKSGDDPTYFSVSTLDDATSSVTGRFNAFDYGAQQRDIFVGISAATGVAGVRGGTVIVDNLDITSQAAGQGSADGNDIIDLLLAVCDHAQASFAADADVHAWTIGFGPVASNGVVQSAAFDIFNLATSSGFTAHLDVTAINSSGDASVLTTDASVVSGIAAGASHTFMAEFDPTAAGPGEYAATYVLNVADEDLPGATTGPPLVLTLTGTISSALFPFDDDGDGDVDELDAANFIGCLTGPEGGLLQPACLNHDWDSDGDVDLYDAAGLLGAFTGSIP